MRVARILAMSVVAASWVLDIDQAQAQVPAEFPPESFTGRQYVDSKGCVFVRAGIDGAVTWVPRMTRQRKLVCGFQPSDAGSGTRVAAAPKPGPEPEIITVPTATTAPKPAAATTTTAATAPAKPKPKPKTVKVRRPAPTTTTAAATTPARVTAPATTAPAPKAVKPATTTTRTAAAPATVRYSCPGGSAISGRYMTHSSLEVRCGSQTAAHRTGTTATYAASSGRAVRTAPAMVPASSYTRPTYVSTTTYAAAPATATFAASGNSAGQVRTAPRRIHDNRVNSTRGVYVPEGYQPVWDDDRLNPWRAHRTADGVAQMDLVWSRTTPRRLIDRSTGRVVDPVAVGVQYPYTSYEQQQAAGVTTISTRGAAATPQRSVPRGRSIHARYKDTPATATGSGPTVSTRSTRTRTGARDERFDR